MHRVTWCGSGHDLGQASGLHHIVHFDGLPHTLLLAAYCPLHISQLEVQQQLHSTFIRIVPSSVLRAACNFEFLACRQTFALSTIAHFHFRNEGPYQWLAAAAAQARDAAPLA